MTAYYNEFDPYAAAWLRNLIAAGHIAPGVVDDRSIEDVTPDDLRGFTQCHFFAGIGVWSHALRSAGWADDREVWTGSCPCQPFSAAGKGLGFADERHLWPAFHHLIAERRPAVVLGEQVASKDVDAWIDLVHADLEAMGYAFGSVPFPSAGVGAPHIRDRNYWVANAMRAGSLPGTHAGVHRGEKSARPRNGKPQRLGAIGGVAYPDGWDASAERQQRSGEQRQQPQDGSAGGLADSHSGAGGQGGEDIRGRTAGSDAEPRAGFGGVVVFGGLADTKRARICGESGSEHSPQAGAGDRQHLHDPVAGGNAVRPSPTNGYWRDADWLGCTDGKWRPVEPGTFPLAHGAASRVGRLRAYGNAVNAEAARVWIETVMECQP